jgi:hypothetical protein
MVTVSVIENVDNFMKWLGICPPKQHSSRQNQWTLYSDNMKMNAPAFCQRSGERYR